MFPWTSSSSGNDNYEDYSSHQWTNYHDQVVDHHIKLNEMPHISTHTKAQATSWARNIGQYFDKVSTASLLASWAAVITHHGVNKAEAKQIALELSHHCADISLFSNLIGNFWNECMVHDQRQVNPTVNSARVALATLRTKASKS